MDRISDLPQDILQRILYFLSQEDAVRTCVLSKSWRYIWCTRPNLDFSDSSSYFKGNIQEFLSVVDKNLRRYCDQRLCLQELRLCISLLDHELVSLLEKWIPLFTCMGVNEFQLSIIVDHTVPGIIDLPSVVFEAESLKLLHLSRCTLGQKIPDNIRFARLQELRLYHVLIEEETFNKIISTCPLLTTMWLQFCEGLETIKLEKQRHKYLKHFVFTTGTGADESSVEIDDIPTLETVKIVGSKILFHTLKFSNLKTLTLEGVEISSNSIEQSQLCIDAPNIEYFNYSGCFIPSISFAPTSKGSCLKLYIVDVGDAQSWFLRLSKLLQALRKSEIFPSIFHLSGSIMHIQQDILVQDIVNGGNKPVVMENLQLTFAHVPALVSFLNGLFCICRPRNMEPSLFSSILKNKEREKKELSELWCKIQMMRESGNQEIWHDLEDLTIEISDRSRQQWRPLQGINSSESALLPDFDCIRFRLKWRED